MKRALLLIIAAFSLTVGFSASALAATRYWSVTIFTPAASDTSHTLNVAYNVLSTEANDVYTVKLYQNEVEVGSQVVDHGKGGNSGAFNIALPSNGTYNYMISANNTTAAEVKNTDTKTVKIVDGPKPSVTTVTVNNADQNGSTGATGTTAANGAETATTAATTAAGQTNGANNTNGQVDASGDNKTGSGTLGAETTNKKSNNKLSWAAGLAGTAALLVAGYYWIRRRSELE